MSAKAKKILEEFQRLPASEKRWLLQKLIAGPVRSEPAVEEVSDSPEASERLEGIHENRRNAAMNEWLAMGGTGHSDATDVSENKSKHLAEVYKTKS